MLQCEYFNRKSPNYVERIVKDYELDFYLEGDRIMSLDGSTFSISKGDMVFRKPGQFVTSRGNYNCYMLSIDFNGKIDIPREIYIRQRETEEQEICNNPVLSLLPPIFKPFHNTDYIQIFEKLRALAYPHPIDLPMHRGLLSELFHLLASDIIRENLTASQKQNQNQAVSDACRLIKTRYMEKLTVDIMAEHVHLSPNYFIKIFKKEIGMPPNEYLIRIRFENARVLLVETNHTIKSIAYMCGYEDAAYFDFAFKKRYNRTPLEYRNNYN